MFTNDLGHMKETRAGVKLFDELCMTLIGLNKDAFIANKYNIYGPSR